VRRNGQRIGASGQVVTYARWVSGAALGCVLCSAVARADVGTASTVAGFDGSVSTGGSAAGAHDPSPDPGLGPDEVIGIVLHALQHNDDPVTDHGIAITFAFTSPENHDVIGPLDRFRVLVKSPAYRPMIGHTHADRGPMSVVAGHAREQVAITGAHGEHAVYMFLLSRQEVGEHKGCWMADGVLREADPVLDVPGHGLLTPVVLRHD
jgi:hypothetical protein